MQSNGNLLGADICSGDIVVVDHESKGCLVFDGEHFHSGILTTLHLYSFITQFVQHLKDPIGGFWDSMYRLQAKASMEWLGKLSAFFK